MMVKDGLRLGQPLFSRRQHGGGLGGRGEAGEGSIALLVPEGPGSDHRRCRWSRCRLVELGALRTRLQAGIDEGLALPQRQGCR